MGFEQGLSGLNAASQDLDVIGNNVANASTNGYKQSRADFSDLYAAALNGSSSVDNQIGIGAQVTTVQQEFTQGSIDITGNPLDVAINGGGYFQLAAASGGPDVYSRNGAFQQNSQGYIVNSSGLQLLGYPATNGVVQSGGTPVPLVAPVGGTLAAKATTKVAMGFNLDSADKITAPVTTAADPTDPTSVATYGTGITLGDPTSYNNATSMTLYDAKGNAVDVTAYFQKTSTDTANGDDQWNVYLTANGQAITTDANGNAIDVDSSGNPQEPYTTIEFPATGGSPDSATNTSAAGSPIDYSNLQISIPASTNAAGAATLPIPYNDPLNPVDPAPTMTLNLSGATEGASAFSVSSLTQDGYAQGNLTGVQIADDGTVEGEYSNGQSQALGQVALANFANANGLAPESGNVWAATQASGQAVQGVAGTGSMGSLQTGALEESNVDLTSELVNMITAQRVYQANAQTIKTEDQVMQTLVNLQ